jgi:hypothetical protein
MSLFDKLLFAAMGVGLFALIPVGLWAARRARWTPPPVEMDGSDSDDI